ncbi:hypothetical protein CKO31_25040 [Thiohalocapsa halophila]|uniref:Probable membrane transporter protein n=1 Tax=Thiohalocapsa halophila TaxID=69359 RepID=A0ABS1CPR1_9GAMM|nr:sulfite exporter TauE/SafE family protein [Thiohalocapsa halophila]MBK1633933.1 hypothetical protein [Thiohalocapsa halophila]
MPDPSGVYAAAVLAASAFVHGIFGLGFPMLATPLLAFGMDLRAAVQLTLLPTIATNLGSIAGERHRGEALRRFWPESKPGPGRNGTKIREVAFRGAAYRFDLA